MKASKILEKIDYVPRWTLYVVSLFIGFPITTLGLYIVLHALEHRAKLDAQQEAEDMVQGSKGDTRRNNGYDVRSEAPKRTARPKASSARGAKAQYDPIDPEAGLEEVLRQGRSMMRRIRQANDAIPDPVLTAKIDSIEESCVEILSMLEQRPELLADLRTFLRYYLPTTMKLLDARAQLDDAGTPKGREVRQRIGVALGEIEKAFRNQVAALEEYRFVDLESEMDVLSQMLHSDGLVNDEEDPFAMTGRTAGGR